MRFIKWILATFCIHIHFNHGFLVLKNRNTTERHQILTINGVKWTQTREFDLWSQWRNNENNSTLNTTNIMIIPLHKPFDGFNLCDENLFRSEVFENRVKMLLQAMNSPVEQEEHGGGHWMGYIDYTSSANFCGSAKLHFEYTYYVARLVQIAGGKGLMCHGYSPFFGVFVPPDVNVLEKTVKGTKMTIPVTIVKTTVPEVWLDEMSLQYDVLEYSGDVNPWSGMYTAGSIGARC